MAVQKSKKSPSKRGMHRSHSALKKPALAIEPTTGEVHLRHHISLSGTYRGQQIVEKKWRRLRRLKGRSIELGSFQLGIKDVKNSSRCDRW